MAHPNRILVVDDDSDQLMMLGMILKDENYEILEASSGQEALDILKDNQVDIVVTDLAMPGMDGLEFATRLKQLSGHERTPVVLVTAGKEMIEFSSRPFRADAFCLKQNIMSKLLPSLRSLMPATTPRVVTELT